MNSENVPTHPSPKFATFLRGFAAVCGLILLVSLASAQGVISGRVSNASTGVFLEGAVVEIDALNLRTSTERDGSFTLSPIPVGSHQVRVYYTGLQIWTRVFEITAASPAVTNLNVGMGELAETVHLEAFTVVGEREGNAVAITRQRASANIVNVLSMDAYGNVADGNIGNFLQNIPGVTANIEAGDVVGVGLRGTPPEMNAVTLDGTRSASPPIGVMPQGDRAMLIDHIPSDSIKEIEVTKANRPDQPADSLGGSVNLVTKSAFDYRGRVVTYRTGANVNTYRARSRVTPTAAATFMDTFMDRRLGVSLSTSYTETHNHRDRIHMAYRDGDLRNSRARHLDDSNERVRAGVSANLEYRFDSTMRVWLKLSANYYEFETSRQSHQALATGSRRVADYSRVSRAAIEAGTTPRDSSGATAGIAPGYTETFSELLNSTWTVTAARESRRQRASKAAAGFEKRFSAGKVTFEASFNPSSATNNYYGMNADLTGVGMAIDRSGDFYRPWYKQTYGPSVAYGSDFSRYKATWFEQPDRTADEIGNVRLDAEKQLQIAGHALRMKAGADVRHEHRWFVNSYRPSWLYVGADGVQGTNTKTGLNDDNIKQFVFERPGYGIFNGYYPGYDELNLSSIMQYYHEHPGYFSPSGTTVSKVAIPGVGSETVSSEYVQGDLRLGKLNVLGGVRFEHTSLNARGSLTDPKNSETGTIEREGDYDELFPSLHLRYAAHRNLVARASISTSCARPQMSDLVPNTTVSYSSGGDLGSVVSSNPGLKPQYSKNYDFSVEYYLEPAGVLSAGVFRKDVSDFITSVTDYIGDGPNNGFGGNYEDFTLTTATNLGKARIDGFEANYSQRLVFLPKPFNSLSVWGNYTRLSTSGTYASGTSPLAGYVPKAFNIGLTYSWKQWEFRATYHYKSGYLYRGSAANEGTSVTDDPTVDLNVQYRFRPWLTVFADYINIFNHSPNWYIGDEARTYMIEKYGARLNVGVSGRF